MVNPSSGYLNAEGYARWKQAVGSDKVGAHDLMFLLLYKNANENNLQQYLQDNEHSTTDAPVEHNNRGFDGC